MATRSRILAWRISMDRGAWRAIVHGVATVRHDLATRPPPPKTETRGQAGVRMPRCECAECRGEMTSLVWASVSSSLHAQSLSRVQLFATPRTAAHQAPLSLESSRQEYWSGVPFSSLGDPTDPGIKPKFPAWQANSLSLRHLGRIKTVTS